MVYGSRFLGNIKGMNFLHYFGNRVLSLFAQLLYNINITDIMTGHKAFLRYVFKNILLTENRFEFEIEITSKIFKSNFRFLEVPISYQYRRYGLSKINFIDGLSSLLKLFLYRIKN